jgi:hypothetical protein
MKQINVKIEDDIYQTFVQKCSDLGITPVNYIREWISKDIQGNSNYNSTISKDIQNEYVPQPSIHSIPGIQYAIPVIQPAIQPAIQSSEVLEQLKVLMLKIDSVENNITTQLESIQATISKKLEAVEWVECIDDPNDFCHDVKAPTLKINLPESRIEFPLGLPKIESRVK